MRQGKLREMCCENEQLQALRFQEISLFFHNWNSTKLYSKPQRPYSWKRFFYYLQHTRLLHDLAKEGDPLQRGKHYPPPQIRCNNYVPLEFSLSSSFPSSQLIIIRLK